MGSLLCSRSWYSSGGISSGSICSSGIGYSALASSSLLCSGLKPRSRIRQRACMGSMETSAAQVAQADVGATGVELPLKKIPGGYGVPILSPLLNRWKFFYVEGEPKFWENRMAKYNSTVIRTNMPPGWPWTNSKCIMLLDQKSYPIVFDSDKVDKTRAFAGTYMPSTSYTGGLDMCAYLDPADKKHAQLKKYCFELLRLSHARWMPEFHNYIAGAFSTWESDLAKSGSIKIASGLVDEAMFKFMIKAMTDVDIDKIPKAERPQCGAMKNWVGFQLIPVVRAGLPAILEDLLHCAPIPFILTKSGYNKMVKCMEKYAGDSLTLAQNYDVDKYEAVHNLIFFLILNGHGGFGRFFPVIIEKVGADAKLQAALRAEVHAAVTANGGALNMNAMQEMPLVTSTVYEALRIDPPVPYQYARAKKDFIIESHDARHQIKKGDFLGGVNYIVSRDPKVFTDPDTFRGDRFMGDGEKLLHNLVWSNGHQTDEPSENTKQCAGKEIVPFTGRLLLAELFTRYESYEINPETKTLTSLKAASP